jgi:hypothetical protein
MCRERKQVHFLLSQFQLQYIFFEYKMNQFVKQNSYSSTLIKLDQIEFNTLDTT